MKHSFIKIVARSMAITFMLSEKEGFFRKAIFQPLSLMFVKMAVASWKKGGVSAWDSFHKPLWYEAGRARASRLIKKMKIVPGDARSIGLFHDYEDPMFSITGEWEVYEKEYAVRVEKDCPLISPYLIKAGCADVCRVLIMELERGTYETIGKNYTFECTGELISAGDSVCRFCHRIKTED